MGTYYVRDGSERIDGFRSWQNLRYEREQGTSQALLTADLTTSPSSLVGAWTLIFGTEPKIIRCYFNTFTQEKISYIDQGKFRPMKCLFCGKDGFPIGTTGYALCPEDMKRVILCFTIRDQVTELYRTMEQYRLIPKEAAPAAEVVKKRGRPPKRPEAVPAQAGAGEATPEVRQPQEGAEQQG
jgi:hypothetical protein